MIPPATGNNAVITVRVGGNRTGLTAVGGLAGVQLGFYDEATGGSPRFTCTSDADGDCSITVPNTQPGGANRNDRFFVREIAPAAGHYNNPNLGTGTTVSSDPYRFRTGTELHNGEIYRSTADFMVATGSGNNEASGGIWQNSRNNPTFPAKCGLNVAILHDLSNSLSSADLTALKAASTGFVDALTGTPSQVATFTFASDAPATGGNNATLGLTPVSTAAGATIVKNRINGYSLPGGQAGGTNWDRGIYQVAQSASSFDVLVVITDGNPTYYGTREGPGNRTRFRELENGIFSANAVKAESTKVIAFGVGTAVGNAASGLNLRSISGPIEGTDFYRTTDYDAAGEQLRRLALGSCQGSVTVVKQVVPASTPVGSTAGAQPQAGWTFTGTGSPGVTVVAPTARITGATGAANFPLTFAGGTTSGPVTLVETPQGGYQLHQGVAGQNAVCRNIDTGANVVPTNVADGFTVQASSQAPISCTVYNRAPNPLASVQLDKSWVINGATYADGSQPDGFTAGGLINGTTQDWGVERTGFRQGDSVSLDEQNVTAPPQCVLTPGRLTTANGAAVDLPLPASQTLDAGLNSYTITNVATCQTRLTLVKTVRGGTAQPADWTLSAAGPDRTITGITGTPAVTGQAVTPATRYILSESGGDPNYVQVTDPNAVLWPGATGSAVCQEVDTDGTTVIPGFSDGLNGGVIVPLGRWVRCTLTNVTSTLQLRKLVVNDNGGTAAPGDWQLTATPVAPTPLPPGVGPITVTGSAVYQPFNVRPNVTYRLTESGPSGYRLVGIECEVSGAPPRDDALITLAALETGSCTFTNDDESATLTLVKDVINDNGGTAAATEWTLAADGPTPISGVTGTAAVTDAEVSAGSYDLSESGGPVGYTAGDWTCTGGTLTGSSVVVPNGGDVRCTIVNNDQPAQLTLVKQVVNQAGGTAVPDDWTLSADGPTPVSGAGNSPDVTDQTVDAGDYDLSESNGPDGYTASDWTCTGGDLTGSTVAVPSGGDVTCTITNTDQPAQLTLVKSVINDNGGTAAETDWTLAADGPTPISGVTGTAAVTDATVSAGSYDLSETGGPAGYTAGDWSCTGGDLTGSSVVVPNGGDVTCTIVNNDQPAQLTLVKVVDNGATGATGAPGDWTLTADGPTPITGPGNSPAVTAQTVDAGGYDLSESGGQDGYTAGDWDCIGGDLTGATVTVPNGGDVTCTITNTAQQSQLTLVKTVVNDNGGTADASEWTLAANGPTGGISGGTGNAEVTDVPVQVGDYDLSESGGPAGYTAGDWTCEGGDLSGATVTVALGEDVTCTIVNNDQPAQLTLVKVVDNGTTGATAAPDDWTLTADGATPITGAGNSPEVTDQTVDAGGYTLSETDGPEGYTASDWTCTGGAVTTDVVTVPNGGNVTCSITNTAEPVSLTLVKIVDNVDTGATTEASEWTLTATGPTVIEGTTPATDVTEVGTYDLAEDGPEGYDASDWECTGASSATADTVTLALGDAATCTITNTAQQPHLTLIKTVTNDHGGSAVPTDWTLSGTGPTAGVSGATGDAAITDRPVAVGDYVLLEAGGPTGYTAGDWTCTGGELTGSTVSVALGDDVECTINNDDQPALLTLVKVVDDPDGSGTTHTPADWTLTAEPQGITGQGTVSGNGDPASPGGVNQVPVFAAATSSARTGRTASRDRCGSAPAAWWQQTWSPSRVAATSPAASPTPPSPPG